MQNNILHCSYYRYGVLTLVNSIMYCIYMYIACTLVKSDALVRVGVACRSGSCNREREPAIDARNFNIACKSQRGHREVTERLQRKGKLMKLKFAHTENLPMTQLLPIGYLKTGHGMTGSLPPQGHTHAQSKLNLWFP